MKKRILMAVSVLLCLIIMCLSAYKQNSEADIIEIDWYSDINYWHGVNWSLEEDTITGQITKATGIMCNMDVPEQNAVQELKVRILENELPDVITIVDESLRKQLIDSGKVWNLEEFLQTYDPNSHILKEFPEDLKAEIIQEEGGWYGYPSHMRSVDLMDIYPVCDEYYFSSNYYNNNGAIIFNRKWLEEFGIAEKDLQTEDQVFDALMLAKEWKETQKSSLIPLLLDGQRYIDSSLDFLSNSFGALMLSEDGTYQNIMFSNSRKHAIWYMNKLYKNGIVDVNQFVYENEDVKARIAEDNVFCFIGAVTNTAYDAREWYSPGPVLSSEGTSPTAPIRTQTSKWLSTYIVKDCNEPEKIAEWLSYMTSEEGLKVHLLGIEGEDYIVNADGTVLMTEQGILDIDNYEETGLRGFWAFYNSTWLDSIVAPPEEDTQYYADMLVRTALAKHDETKIYEDNLIRSLESEEKITSQFDSLLNEINSYSSDQTLKMILSKDKEEFENIYEETLRGLEEMGVGVLDDALNTIYRERCALYQITAETNLKETELYQKASDSHN